MLPPLSLSLSLSFPHLTGTLCSEISHRVMLMEKDGGGGGVGSECCVSVSERRCPRSSKKGKIEGVGEERGVLFKPPPTYVLINSLTPLHEAAGQYEL